MRKPVLSTAIFAASFAFASCTSAQTGDSEPVSGESIDLGDGSPFVAESHGAFAEPWAIEFEPGTGRIFITEKAGTAKLYDPATGTVMEVTGTPEVAYRGQGGFGDMVFAPGYAENSEIYLTWAQQAGEAGTVATLGRGTLSCSDTACAIEGLTEIWRQSRPGERPGHYSHRIAFSPGGDYLFLSSGDRQEQDPAQDLSNNLGAVLRLNLDGTPTDGNPFADQGSPTDQVWSYGHRNLLGLAFDADGELWDVEHGPAGGDELNHVEAGANYGWPVRSNGNNYNGSDIPDHTDGDGFHHPAIFWDPVIAPGDMLFYDGAMFADWQGDALIANLRTQSISRIETDAAANTADEAARYEFPKRLRSIAVASDGAIWVAEDGADGRLIRLTPAE